ncbi:TPA: YadA-like family protein [Pasteurella multocida]|nr:YadA-like family protein [Pasteurella multocida]
MLKKHNIFMLGIFALISSASYAAVDSDGNIKEGNNAGTNTVGKNNVAISTNAGRNVKGNTNVAISADAGQQVKGNNNISISYKAGNNVDGSNNIAMGRASGSEVNGSFNSSLGYMAGRDIGKSSKSHANQSSGIFSGNNVQGNANIANGAYAGRNVTGNGNIANGAGAGIGVKGDSNIAIGNAAGTKTKTSHMINKQVTASLDPNKEITVVEHQVSNTVSLGTSAVSMETDAVALGSSSVSDIAKGRVGFLAENEQNATWKSTHARVSVGKDSQNEDEKITRQIHNLSAGSKDTDAVNVAQLKKVNSTVDQNTKGLEQLNANVANLRVDFHHLENKLNTINSDLKAGIAGSTAIANLPQAFRNGQSMVSVAVGSYRGQSAAAFGISRMAENSPIVFKASGSANTQGHFNVGAGIGWGW